MILHKKQPSLLTSISSGLHMLWPFAPFNWKIAWLSAWPPHARYFQWARCKHWRLMISFIEWLTSTACILSFIKLIQLVFLYDMLKGVFLIGTNFWSDMMRYCCVVGLSLKQNMWFYKEQTRSQPVVLPACASATCGSTWRSRQKNCDLLIISGSFGGAIIELLSHAVELLKWVWWHLSLYYCDGNFRFT